ncbi:hypothetical protein KEM56_006458 [Ascosphaera pollenicola]|nr:hypothetical protein KEM56_006458 [Ascosphaera pollenicola]
MAHPDESVDFSLIEEQKENIQSLPGGRSARALAAVLSSGAVSNSSASGGLNETNEINATIKKEFEQELQTIDESDDPLDIYDRYVKWTFDAYPSAQATPQSGLLPLLERATKAFLTSSDYKNDPRYLRLWLHYIRLFSDAPREVFTFLVRNGIGERLALFYEEFAAWLESAGRITQAEQIYEMGLEKEARPVERLSRKYREFSKRVESDPRTNEPTSPVLPKVRPALQAKIDPFASARIPSNPQAQSQKAAAPAAPKTTRTGKPKMQIFSDADADGVPDGEETPSDASKGQDTIGFMKERKKENTYEPKPWKGQTLKTASRPERAPKLQIYKDESLAKSTALISDKTLRLRETVNPRSGKVERIYANLELLYPRGGRGREAEMSIDEARAASRGWLSRDWSRRIKEEHLKPRQEGKHMSKTTTQTAPRQDSDEAALPQAFKEKLVIHRDAPAGSEPVPTEKSKSKKSRSPKVVETSSQTQTIKTKLDSPTVSKVRRKNGSSEPTMTFHTRAATDEIYGIFNQPLKAELGGEDEDSPYQSEGYDDDDFTTTTNVTGRLSGATSDFCEGDTTYLNKSTTEEDDIKETVAACDWTGEDVLEQTTSSFPADSQTQDNDAEEDEDDINEQMTPVKRKFPPPPDGYDPPVGLYRDPAVMAQNRLPFMTPIVERTEMSMAYSTYRHGQRDVPKSDSSNDESSLSSQSVGTEPAIESGGPPADDETRFSVFHDESPSKKPRVEQPVPQKHVDQTCVPTKENAQPIIPDKQCNPIDLDVKAKILKAIKPPLGKYPGFYRHTSEGSSYIKEIEHEFGRRTSGASKSRKPVTLNFENLGVHITVTQGLGKGGYASVYLAEEHAPEPCTYCVDNCLVKVADPIFLGFSASKRVSIATKTVRKRNATESVGLIVSKNGNPAVVEYSEIDAETAEAEDEERPGVLKFRAANIVNHYYSIDFLDSIEEWAPKLEHHIARKKIPYLDTETGETVKPTKPNGIKFEQFVFDVFPLLDLEKFASIEVRREDEFSPLKNARGTGEDDPDTSRADIMKQGAKWVKAAGGQAGELVEVSPLVSYGGEGLEFVQGKTVEEGAYAKEKF